MVALLWEWPTDPRIQACIEEVPRDDEERNATIREMLLAREYVPLDWEFRIRAQLGLNCDVPGAISHMALLQLAHAPERAVTAEARAREVWPEHRFVGWTQAIQLQMDPWYSGRRTVAGYYVGGLVRTEMPGLMVRSTGNKVQAPLQALRTLRAEHPEAALLYELGVVPWLFEYDDRPCYILSVARHVRVSQKLSRESSPTMHMISERTQRNTR